MFFVFTEPSPPRYGPTADALLTHSTMTNASASAKLKIFRGPYLGFCGPLMVRGPLVGGHCYKGINKINTDLNLKEIKDFI